MMSKRLTEDRRKKWMSVMKSDYMSSEDSGDDDDTIVVHQPGWRSEYVDRMFAKIDDFNRTTKSAQARRQMKRRITLSTATTSWRDSRVGSQVNCVIKLTFDIRPAVGLYSLVMLSFHL